MGNNNNQKNAIYEENRLNWLAYQNARAATAGRTADFQSSPLAAETINDQFQQLIDNDLYVEHRLNILSGGLPGPANYDIDAMQGAQDGYKAWRIEPDSELSILRKVIDPVSSTIELSYLENERISFIFGCGGMVFAGTDNGLYIQQQGNSGFSRFILNVLEGSNTDEDEDPEDEGGEDEGGEDESDDGNGNEESEDSEDSVNIAVSSEKCTGYYVYNNIILVSTIGAIYCLTIGEHNEMSVVKITSPRINEYRSVYYKKDSGRLFVGTDNGVFSTGWDPFNPQKFSLERNQVVGSGGKAMFPSVNGFFTRNFDDNSLIGEDIIAYTAGNGIFRSSYANSVFDGEIMLQGQVCSRFTHIGDKMYVCTDTGLYDVSTGEILQGLASDYSEIAVSGNVVDVTWLGNRLYAVTNNGVIYGMTATGVMSRKETRIRNISGICAVYVQSVPMVLIQLANGTSIAVDPNGVDAGGSPIPFKTCACNGGRFIYGHDGQNISAIGSFWINETKTDIISALREYEIDGITFSGQDIKQFQSGYFTLSDSIMYGPDVVSKYGNVDQLILLDGGKDASFAAKAGRSVIAFDEEFNDLDIVDLDRNPVDISADCIGQTANNILVADGNALSVIQKDGLKLAGRIPLPFTIKRIVSGAGNLQSYLLLNDGSIRIAKEDMLFETLEPPEFQEQGIAGYDCRNIDSDFFEIQQDDTDTPEQPETGDEGWNWVEDEDEGDDDDTEPDPPGKSYFLTFYSKSQTVSADLSCIAIDPNNDARTISAVSYRIDYSAGQAVRSAVGCGDTQNRGVAVCGSFGADIYGIQGVKTVQDDSGIYDMTIDLSDVSFDGDGRISAILNCHMPFGPVNKCEAGMDGFGIYATDIGLSSFFTENLQVGELQSGVKVKGFQPDESTQVYYMTANGQLSVFVFPYPKTVDTSYDIFGQDNLAGTFSASDADGYWLSVGQAAILAKGDSDESLSVVRAWRPDGQAARSSSELVLSEGVRAVGRPLYGRFFEGDQHVSAFIIGEKLSVMEIREDGVNLAEYADLNVDMAELAEVDEDGTGEVSLMKHCLFTIEDGHVKARAVGEAGLGDPFQVEAWQDLTIVDFRIALDADQTSLRVLALDSGGDLLSAKCSVGNRMFSDAQTVAHNVFMIDKQFVSLRSETGDRLFDLDMNQIYDAAANNNIGLIVGYGFDQFCALDNGNKTQIRQNVSVLRKLQDGRFVDVRRLNQLYFALDGNGNLYKAEPDRQGYYSASKIAGPDVQTFRISDEGRVNVFFRDGTVAWDIENNPGDRRQYFMDPVPQDFQCLPTDVSDTFEDVFLIRVGRAAFTQPDGSSIRFIYDIAGGDVIVEDMPIQYNIAIRDIASDGAGRVFAAQSVRIYRLYENPERLEQVGQVSNGMIRSIAAAGGIPYVQLDDLRVFCLTTAGMNLVPTDGFVLNSVGEDGNGTHVFATSNGIWKPNYAYLKNLIYEQMASREFHANTFQLYGDEYSRAIMAVARDGDGIAAYRIDWNFIDRTIGIQREQADVGLSSGYVDLFQSAYPIQTARGLGAAFFYDGVMYVNKLGKTSKYPDNRLLNRADDVLDVAEYGGRTYIAAKDGVYSSLGTGRAYVFQQVQVPGFTEISVNAHFAATDGERHLLATSRGLYTLAGQKYDIAKDIYKNSIDETSVSYVGEWSPNGVISACAATGRVLSVSGNLRKWQMTLSVTADCGPGEEDCCGILGAYAKNSYEYYLATECGIWTTRMSFKLSNDMEKFTIDKALRVFTDTRGDFAAEYGRQLSAHEDEWHYDGSSTLVARNVIPLLNENYLCVNFDGLQTSAFGIKTSADYGMAVANDLVYEYEYGDQDEGEVHVKTSNFAASSDNADCQYILRRYMSGVTELYIYIPTTQTYYLNHVEGTPGCVLARSKIKRANLSQFGTQVQNTDSNPATHYTTFEVDVEDTLLSVDTLLDVQVDGNSLPLKIYRDYDNAESEENACLLYHSFVEPSQYVADVGVPQKNEQGEYVFRFACFGTDAQAVRIMCYDAVNGVGTSTFTVKYNANGAGGKMPTQRFNIGLPKKLRPNKFMWPEGSAKTFYGWTTRPAPADNELELPDFYADGQEFMLDADHVKNGQVINLYAVWITYQFGDGDTQILIQDPGGATYFNSGSISENEQLGARAAIDYGEVGGRHDQRIVSEISPDTTTVNYNE